ncbi:glycine zipper 2TM domain-containing protein [Uliginosibacterium sp. sgz301328]|uniref:glycine zipper 2TM domain-containing protein n=1 Tax=Uliginosibacterium sp. sgz301328 TaxID=3243764 RepID=UPI00359D4FC2
MKMQHVTVAALCALSLALSACASSKAGDVYSRDEAQRTMTFREGVVSDVRQVKLEGTKTAIGTGAGAVVGGVAGSTIGQGKGQIVGAVLGAVAGGLAGAAAEEGLTRENALQITVKLNNGENIIVVQEMGQDTFVAGDRVRVVQSGGKTRVTR